ncbi:MAG: hypothetical protein JWM05_1213, partial [Acidimicrobiales bacterium]|nr:hypothetical protein [Acidimicrobiales bacterium]
PTDRAPRREGAVAVPPFGFIVLERVDRPRPLLAPAP